MVLRFAFTLMRTIGILTSYVLGLTNFDLCGRLNYGQNPDPIQYYVFPIFADKIEEVIMSEEATKLFRSLVLKGYTLRKIKGCMKEEGYVLDEYDAPYIKMIIDILTEEGE